MLIVIPSMVILIIGTLLVMGVEALGKNKGAKEKELVKEQHIYKRGEFDYIGKTVPPEHEQDSNISTAA